MSKPNEGRDNATDASPKLEGVQEEGYDAAEERRRLLPFMACGAAFILVVFFVVASLLLSLPMWYVPGPR